VRLGVQDIDFYERTVRVRSGKGDKDRLVIIPETVAEVVRSWLQVRPKTSSDALFPGQSGRGHMSTMTVQRAVGDAALTAGITKTVTPHVLRHTLATTLLRRGGDIRFIQRILGHASIATTQVYTHLDDAELKRMYDRAAPDY
jgi:integrase/recombinase XerD